jgi:hypothetical protein
MFNKKGALRFLPSWVEPSVMEQGSIDPLGYLAPRERIAEELLPGMTVATLRARYLSFLCWAINKTGNKPSEIDRWEVALSIGEFLRHSNDDDNCKYLGINIIKRKNLKPGDSVPRYLHVQAARMLYSGLLASCEFVDSDGKLTEEGGRLAELFGSYMTRSLPAKVWKCAELPCLSDIRTKECKILRKALLGKGGGTAQKRLKTFEKIGVRKMRQVLRDGVARLLKSYLDTSINMNDSPAVLLRKAALLELEAVPLTHLFLELYKSAGTLKGCIPSTGKLSLFQIRAENKKSLLYDVGAHLRKAKKLGVNVPPLQFEVLKKEVLNKHRIAKADNPWVDNEWRVLRRGLAPEQSSIYSYRLPAFASLLSDIGEI